MDTLDDTESTDTQALKNLVRKIAAHIQVLEEERVGVVQELSSSLPDIDHNDIRKSIVNLCKKLAQLEDECRKPAKCENNSHSSLLEVCMLRNKIKSLNSEFSESQKEIGKLRRSNIGQGDLIATLRTELSTLPRGSCSRKC
jgi:predicted RNase H-like nuclease (RuvC/YqgF family)